MKRFNEKYKTAYVPNGDKKKPVRYDDKEEEIDSNGNKKKKESSKLDRYESIFFESYDYPDRTIIYKDKSKFNMNKFKSFVFNYSDMELVSVIPYDDYLVVEANMGYSDEEWKIFEKEVAKNFIGVFIL